MATQRSDWDGTGRLFLSAEAVLYFVAGLFAVTGGVATVNGEYEATSAFLFRGFMNVCLPLFVVAGTGYLRRTDLPRSTWWSVVTGYLAGIAFITLLVVWSSLPDLRSGTSLLALRETFVFFGNLGGIFGFVAGVSRARTEYNRQLRRELEARQRELEHQIARLDEFAGIVSHDLRNPLSVAKGHLQLARQDPDATADDLQQVEDALDRMSDIIDDLLTLARAGERPDDLGPVALEEFVRSCWATVQTADATLETDLEGSIEADENRLAQLFENLFRNAVEHGGDDVTVTVDTLPDGFYVVDDGPGVPAADREAVFDADYSTDGGAGLGLSIVAEIADAHDWTVTAVAGSEGGARFEVTGVGRFD